MIVVLWPFGPLECRIWWGWVAGVRGLEKGQIESRSRQRPVGVGAARQQATNAGRAPAQWAEPPKRERARKPGSDATTTTVIEKDADTGGATIPGQSTWYDAEGNWNPPAPGPKQKRAKTAPDEVDAIVVMGDSWIQAHQTTVLPSDLQAIVRAPEATIPVSGHVHKTVATGGKHERDRVYFEHLTEVLENVSLTTSSPRETGWRRQEFYTPINDGWYALTVVGGEPELDGPGVVAFYLVPAGTVTNRLNPEHASSSGRVFSARSRGK